MNFPPTTLLFAFELYFREKEQGRGKVLKSEKWINTFQVIDRSCQVIDCDRLKNIPS